MPTRDVDADLRKRLWLRVAQSVVQRPGSSAEDAIAVLHASGGVLRVEDVLVFFPDLTLIDDFKVQGGGGCGGLASTLITPPPVPSPRMRSPRRSSTRTPRSQTSSTR